MATQTRNPTSDDAVSGTWNGSAGTRYTVVDDYPDTTPTDTLLHGTTAGNLTFGFSAFSIPSNATSISVQVLYYDQKTASQAAASAGRLKVGGSYYNATTHNPATSYTSRSDNWATNPKTGAAWTPAQVNGTDGTNDLQAFGFYSSDASPTINYSSVQLQVTYSVAYTLTSETGTFTETGIAATTLKTRLLTAEVGARTLTGVAAALLRSSLLTSGAGGFILTGNEAGFSYVQSSGYTLPSELGAFSLGLPPAGLLRSHLLASTAGSYSLVGKDASTLRSRRLPGAPGGLSAAFSDAGLVYWVPQQYILGASPAVYTFAGLPAQLFYYDGAQIRILSDGGVLRVGAIGARTEVPWWEGDYRTFDPRLVLRDFLGRTYG
jgi:uncharacterized membrane protein